MASIGDEKKIRALFSELKFADEQTAPSFNAVWHRAQTRSLKPRPAFNFSFAVATALLICGLASLAIWSRYSQPAAPATAYANVSATSHVFALRPSESSNTAGAYLPQKDDPSPAKRRVIKSTARRQVLEIAATASNSQLANEAKAIANWQSPTSDLLSSPSDGLFKSLPQLNENANELKSFLPNRENEKEK
jgi:hypothetical protein